MGYIYNSTYLGKIKHLNPKFKQSMNSSALSRDCKDFKKISENNIVNTSGEQPLLLYKKKDNKISHSFDYKMTKKNSDKNIYISDGGLKLKNEKYKTSYSNTYSNQNKDPKQIKSLRAYLESINVNKVLKAQGTQNKKQVKTKNPKKNKKYEEHIFYKTVRGTSNRPMFHKKVNNNGKNLCNSGEGFALKAKMNFKDKNQNNKPKKKNNLEESKKDDENKKELMVSLINGAIKNNYFIIQNDETKITPKKILADKRKEYLQKNGIGVSDVNLDENDDENIKNDEKDENKKLSKSGNNFNHIKLNNYLKYSNDYSPRQNEYYMTLNNETPFYSHQKNKKQNKPIVDQFEYIKKINKEHKRLCDNLINDLFRHKNKVEPNKKNNYIEKTYLDKKKGDNPSSLVDINDEWPYAHKKSYRTPKELNKFVKEKKLKNKEKANNEELQKNTKLFIKFKNLYNLNYKRVNNNISGIHDKDKDKDKTISTYKSYRPKTSNPGLKRKKETNEYYVGNHSLSNSNSTFIDPNDYYLTVLESQQILVNSDFNRIENESDEETEELTDNNEEEEDDEINENKLQGTNELNTSKEQIQKIIKKESKRKKPNINNNINIDNIKNNLSNKKKTLDNIKLNNNKKIDNNNPKGKSSINQKDIVKFVEVLKFIIQRKIFVILYKAYINQAIYQHYKIAFTYFIAICKHKPFRKIEEYCNFKTYIIIFRKLLLPFIRRSFREFVNNIFFKKKIEFLVSFLTKFFKFKFLQKLFIISQLLENDEEKKHFVLVLSKMMRTLVSPHLRLVFDKLKNYNKNNNNNDNYVKNQITDKKEDIINNKNEPKSDIKDDKKENEINFPQSTSPDLVNEEKYKKINKAYLEYSPTRDNKAKSYLYESSSEESSINIRPNSLDNDQWHQIQMRIQLAKHMLINDLGEDEKEEEEKKENDNGIGDYNNYPQNNSINSKKSEKSFNNNIEKKEELKEPKIDIKHNKGINNINNIKPNNIKEENPQDINIEIIKKDKDEEKDDKKINKKPNNENDALINKDNINENKDNIDKIDKNMNKDNDINEVKNKEKENISKNNINDKDKNNKNIITKKNEEINKEIENKDDSIDIDFEDIKNFIKEKPDINNNISDNKQEDNKEKLNKNNNLNNKINNNNLKKDEIAKEIKEKPKIEEKPKNNNVKNIEDKKIIKKKEELIDSDEEPEEQIKNLTPSELDISAERDNPNNIEWEYNLNNSKKLQSSINSENLKSEEPKEEKLIVNYNIKKIEEKSPDKVIETNDIKIHKDKKKNDINNDDIEEIEDEKNDENKNIEDKKKSKTLVKDKNPLNESEDEYADDFEVDDIDLVNLEQDSDLDSKNTKKIKIEKNKDIKIDSKEKNDKSRNINLEDNIEDIKIENKNIENKEKSKPPSTSKSFEILKNIKDKEKLANDLTDEIIKKLLSSEITSNSVKLIPHKSFKYELFNNLKDSNSNLSASYGSAGNNFRNDLGLLSLGQLSLNEDLLNDSIMSSYTAFSVFNRTIKDKKKEHSLNLYYKKIAPKLIKLIKKEIYLKYPRIYENISTPLKNQSVGLMMSLSLQDADMLRDNYKCNLMKENIKDIIDKEKILKTFEPINRQIRSKDNLTSDNFYDNMLNECLIDTTIELINKERLYGENGDPLEWSSRTHELAFKYKKDDPKKLAKYVCQNLLKTLHTRIGLITDNYDYMNAEQINNERDKRLIDNIKNELDEDEYQWRNLEMEETQLKVELTELIMDQLFNENIEILEHIQYSRNRPDLYQNKSIYSCEEIPKLSFQRTTTDNAAKDKDDGDEVINV